MIMTSSLFIGLFQPGIVFSKTVRKNANPSLRLAFNQTLHSGAGKIKTILLWNKFFNMKHFDFGTGQSAFEDAGCAVTSCAIWDQEDGNTDLPHDSFDAVVFHVVDIFSGRLLDKMPLVRSPSQLYTFMLLEPPALYRFNLRGMTFNVTMTYRRDSDIYSPYGWIASRNISSEAVRAMSPSKASTVWMEQSFRDITPKPWTLSTKTKAVAWIVSRCRTPGKREEYVNEMSKHIAVDVYGACGNLKCSKRSRPMCYQMVENKYWFYLSFENCLCKDYVSEKFFNILKLYVVPVVYGGAEYEKIAPPKSYIDVRDFSSPKELANYLTYLIETPREYDKYFWWKEHFQAVRNPVKIMFCSLCEMLNNPLLHSQGHRDFESWWNGPGVCHSRQEHFQSGNATRSGRFGKKGVGK